MNSGLLPVCSHHRCSSCGCDSPQRMELGHLSPDSYSRDDTTKLHSEYSSSSCGRCTLPMFGRTVLNKPQRCTDYMSTFVAPHLSTENSTSFCNGCGSKFTEEDALKDHLVQVHSDKPYKCDCCQAAFRYKGNLASHKTVHTGKNSNTSLSFESFIKLTSWMRMF